MTSPPAHSICDAVYTFIQRDGIMLLLLLMMMCLSGSFNFFFFQLRDDESEISNLKRENETLDFVCSTIFFQSGAILTMMKMKETLLLLCNRKKKEKGKEKIGWV